MSKEDHVLLIEDNPGDIFLLQESIKLEGESIFFSIAKDAECAIEFLLNSYSKKELPKLIILDLNLPGMNGIDFLELKRTIAIISDIPVVLFTTSTYKKEIDKCLELGAVNYFSKPMNFEDYIHIVKFIGNFFHKEKSLLNTF